MRPYHNQKVLMTMAPKDICIGIYTGEGASHSWIWFGEILDRMGFHHVSFLSEGLLKQVMPEEFDVLVISGGDTFEIAGILGEKGAKSLRTFIEEGGTFIGTCAGAYLPLNSSKTPLNLFNFVPAKIANLKDNLPECTALSEKFCTPYGCRYIYHAVRESVKIRGAGEYPFDFFSEIEAPLYGGPPILPCEDIKVLAYYSDFTPQTVFLVAPSIARETLIGKVAALRKDMGKGKIYLFGPHLEHPYFPEANGLLGKLILGCQRSKGDEKQKGKDQGASSYSSDSLEIFRSLKGEVSNGRIMASGLAQKRLSWKIGNKLWEAEKAVYFFETVWKKMNFVEKHLDEGIDSKRLVDILQLARTSFNSLKDLKDAMEKDEDTLSLAEVLFRELRTLCSEFMQLYFDLRLAYGYHSGH